MIDEATYLGELAALWDKAWPHEVARGLGYVRGEQPISRYLSAWAKEQPDKTAYIYYGTRITYREADENSGRLAAFLRSQGVAKGDRVAVYMPNCPQFVYAFYAVLKLGCIYVPVSTMATAHELGHQLRDSGATVMITATGLLSKVAEASAGHPLKLIVRTDPREALPAVPEISVHKSLLEAPDPAPSSLKTVDLLQAIRGLEPFAERYDDDLDAPAALNYTGGTTGLPKGCIHTQRDMVYISAASAFCFGGGDSESVSLSFLPMFWIAGENLSLLYPIYSGSTHVLLARWDAQAFMSAVEKFKVNSTALPVDGVEELLQDPASRSIDWSSLMQTTGISLVKKMSPHYRREWRQLTGAPLYCGGFGMTETHTGNTFTIGMDKDDLDFNSPPPLFCGLPVVGTQLKICAFGSSEILPLGEEGEILIRTPSLLKGYWNNPEGAGALEDGWLRTGDIGVLDTRGYLHWLGRRKEMLKVNGMNVYPAEIEIILASHPAARGAAVVGRPDEQKGEVPVGFVVVPDESRHEAVRSELLAACREKLAIYKQPEIIPIVAFPMTGTGKVRKRDLIEKYFQRAG